MSVLRSSGVVGLLCLVFSVVVQAEDALVRREWLVDGVTREALVHIPASAKSTYAPLIFGFHGHGGSMRNASTQYHFHVLWPEAIVVYPQGLNTAGKLTDPEGKKAGWQNGPGDQADRDLKFFDAMFASLTKDCKVDEKHVFSSGHSNGGGFTYLLWAARGEKFAAMAPSAAAATYFTLLKPKPVLHVAGENDPLVKFAWQKLMMEKVREINQCGEGKAWDLDKNCTIYESKLGTPVITAIHPGTHTYPKEAPEVIVKFFKSQMKP